MKLILALVFCLTVCGYSHTVDVKKSNCYLVKDFAKAQKEAKTKGKPLLVITTEINTNWYPCFVASSSLIKEGTKSCIVVIVESKDVQKLPKAYNKIFDHSKRGTYIPFAGLIDNDLKQVKMYLKYEEVKNKSSKPLA